MGARRKLWYCIIATLIRTSYFDLTSRQSAPKFTSKNASVLPQHLVGLFLQQPAEGSVEGPALDLRLWRAAAAGGRSLGATEGPDRGAQVLRWESQQKVKLKTGGAEAKHMKMSGDLIFVGDVFFFGDFVASWDLVTKGHFSDHWETHGVLRGQRHISMQLRLVCQRPGLNLYVSRPKFIKLRKTGPATLGPVLRL